MENDPEFTHFGYRTVPTGGKPELVDEVFASVASRYDLMNDLMSLGVHRIWKNALVDWAAPVPGQRFLDVAGGTGDIAVRLLKRSQGGRAVVLDMNPDMVRAGTMRQPRGMSGEIVWTVGNAEEMPFVSKSFDLCTIAFGARNFARLPDGLRECFRVLDHGGRLLVLEFSNVPNALLRRLYEQLFPCGHPASGPGGDGRPRELPVSCREHQEISRSGGIWRND